METAVERFPPLAEFRRDLCVVSGRPVLRISALCGAGWGGSWLEATSEELRDFASRLLDEVPGARHPVCLRWLARNAMRIESRDDPAAGLCDARNLSLEGLFRLVAERPYMGVRFAKRRESGWFGASTPYGEAYTAVQPEAITGQLNLLHDWHTRSKSFGWLAQLVLWHQLVCIHPLRDGNGRFSRLASIATSPDLPSALVMGTCWGLMLGSGAMAEAFARAQRSAIASGRIDAFLWELLDSRDTLRACLSQTAATVDWLMRTLPAACEPLICGEAVEQSELEMRIGRSARVAGRLLESAVAAGHLVAQGKSFRLRRPWTS